jgi:hypothetical protein
LLVQAGRIDAGFVFSFHSLALLHARRVGSKAGKKTHLTSSGVFSLEEDVLSGRHGSCRGGLYIFRRIFRYIFRTRQYQSQLVSGYIPDAFGRFQFGNIYAKRLIILF